ncbi:MAG: hypothetical protein ACYC2I_04695 [Elusimicrobiales bacterium]
MRTAAIALLLACAAPACAEETVSFKLTPPASGVKLAEPFKVKVEASYPARYSIRPDTAAAGNEEFEVLSFTRLDSGTAGELKTDTFEIAAKPFALGQSTFPAVTWELVADGAPPAAAKSPPFLVEILPLFKDAEDGIRDIYPPYRYPPWLWILAGLLAAALAVHLFRKLRRKDAAGGGLYSGWKDGRTPYQRARERLERLSATPLAAAGRMRELYTGFTAVLRLYLGEEFGLDAELMTTADLARELKTTGAELKTTLKAREFLEKADLVKFAKMQPPDAAGDSAALLELLGEFARAADAARAKAAQAAAEAALRAKAGGKA